jgi:hypothetical protein
MQTEPVEMYRGVLIYQDMKEKAGERTTSYRAIVSAEPFEAHTLKSLKQWIDSKVGPSHFATQ